MTLSFIPVRPPHGSGRPRADAGNSASPEDGRTANALQAAKSCSSPGSVGTATSSMALPPGLTARPVQGMFHPSAKPSSDELTPPARAVNATANDHANLAGCKGDSNTARSWPKEAPTVPSTMHTEKG